MTRSTLERPSFTPEAEKASHLALSGITAIEKLPKWSPFELRTIAPTDERPVAVFLATPKEEDVDTMRGSLIAIKESADAPNSMEAFWQVDPNSMSVVRTSANDMIEQMGVGDDASIAGTFKIKQGDKLFFMTNERLDALKKSGQFTKDGIDLVLGNENERQEIIEITVDPAAAVDSVPAELDVAEANKPVKPGAVSKKQQLIESRKANKAKNDRHQARAVENSTPTDDNTTAAEPTVVTPLIFAQSKRAPKHAADTASHPPVAASQEVDDEERQQENDAKRGFTVVNKRVRSRDELLNAPLKELVTGIDISKITDQHQAEQLTSMQKSFADKKAADEKKQPISPAAKTHSNQDLSQVPSVEGHEPLLQGPMNRVTVTTHYDVPLKPDRAPIIQNYSIPDRPDHEPMAQDSSDEKDKFSLINLMTKMHTYFSTKHFMRQNNRQPRNPEKEKRLKKIAVIATMGTVGFVAWKLNPEWQNSFGDMLDTIVPGATDAVNETFPGAINTGEGLNQGVDTNTGISQSDILDQRTENLRTEILESPAHVIPVAGGGEAYVVANGADPAIWRQNQAEFLQLFPNEAYLMVDGDVGFDRPGELSDPAKEYWAKKFGQWR